MLCIFAWWHALINAVQAPGFFKAADLVLRWESTDGWRGKGKNGIRNWRVLRAWLPNQEMYTARHSAMLQSTCLTLGGKKNFGEGVWAYGCCKLRDSRFHQCLVGPGSPPRPRPKSWKLLERDHKPIPLWMLEKWLGRVFCFVFNSLETWKSHLNGGNSGMTTYMKMRSQISFLFSNLVEIGPSLLKGASLALKVSLLNLPV